ncbi:MAG TPA: GNAT family N-acetyltransferase [Acidimicrobiales bacterium]|nr:GNAT family N-acetyltransferase [Acidimicrobiales bacterium]
MLEDGAAAEVAGLRRALAAARPERIAPHVTLVAPVNVASAELEDVVRAIGRLAASTRPFAATLGPVGTFAPERPVVYLSVSGAARELDELHRGASAGPLAPPAARPPRPFVPHVTLSSAVDPPLVEACLAALAGYGRETTFTHLHLLAQDTAAPERPWRTVASPALGGSAVRARGGREVELSLASHLDLVTAAWARERWGEYARETYGASWRPDEPFAVLARARTGPPGDAGALLGVATGEIRGETCECERLIVAPDSRGEGVGSRLLDHVERYAAERGCRSVRLRTIDGGEAERFYAARGYVRGALLPRWRAGRDFVVMARELAGRA